jgi:hypothetical protein
MELQGYVPYASNTPHQITSRDKLVAVTDKGTTFVVNILLTRRKVLICRKANDEHAKKFEMYFTVWDQQDGLPRIANGYQWTLYVPVDAPASDAKPVVKRVNAAPGETKIAKCRAIYAAHKDLDKEALLAKFVAEAGCTPAGAVTYLITCRKG